MIMTDAGYALLKSFEQCSLRAYLDETEVFYTIGWGHLLSHDPAYANTVWSQEQADATLIDDVSRTVDELLDMIEPELTDNEFSACVCLAFNIGTHAFVGSSVLAFINMDSASSVWLNQVPTHIRLWNKVHINGVLHVSRGLVRRREAEVALWNTP